ncbi:MAG: nitrate reductase [Alphaproteobacteria bacterium HGW-Alphaproteobacteria-12]|nr:MAG: nitrate reductase [Alphaproteobacteria bacterium HGW-Alphaproteobacteria-12]
MPIPLTAILAIFLSVVFTTFALASEPEFIKFDTQRVVYREAGEFLLDTAPVNGPIGEIGAGRTFEIMRRQVTRGEYDRCVAAGRCAPLEVASAPDLSVVGVNFDDALAYAQWRSEITGVTHRLPTDREWAIAAGSRYADEGYGIADDPKNPAIRWLSRYDAEVASGRTADPVLRPAGAFGANEHGLLDLSGNVWEWTSTCFSRQATDSRTGKRDHNENCGVRVAEGAHRAYISSFIRDPRGGACSVGIPPDNLGIRLVREDSGMLGRLRNLLRR